MIASTWRAGGISKVAVMKLDGVDKPQRITSFDGYLTGPFAWSPNSSKLAYVAERHHSNVMVGEVDDQQSKGRQTRQITSDGDWSRITSIAWSPNGDKIAYFAEGARGTGIVVSDANGRNLRLIAEHPIQAADDLQWSPDQSRLIYSRRVNGQAELFAIDPDGQNLVKLSEDGVKGWAQHPMWSQDGQTISYTRSYDGQDTFVAAIDGGKRARLARESIGLDS
jgi:Tol biopolymer transport system component